MNRTFKDQYISRAISYLPVRLAERIRTSCDLKEEYLTEIRITVGAEIQLTTSKHTVFIPIICTRDDMRYIIRSLCGNSVYSHSETMKDGFITTSDGIRAGIAGRAVSHGGTVIGMTDVTSVVIRIPGRFPGAANELYSILEKYNWCGSVLVYSEPSGGKTTLLRELAALTGNKDTYKKTVVIDSRCEITCDIEGCATTVLLGYPRHKGIEIAIRTLSPEIIICDEISSEEDVAAALECLGTGVTLVASTHGTMSDIFNRKIVKELLPYNLFSAYYGIIKGEGTITGILTESKELKC